MCATKNNEVMNYFTNMLQCTNCPRECDTVEYEFTEAQPHKDYFSLDVPGIIKFMDFDRNAEIREEYFSYTTSNLVTDFGANLGLCLGCSILTFSEVAYHTIRRVLAFLIKTRANVARNRAVQDETRVVS